MARRIMIGLVLLVALAALSGAVSAGAIPTVNYYNLVVDCTGASVTFDEAAGNYYLWSLDIDSTFVDQVGPFPAQSAIAVTATNVGALNDPFPYTSGDHVAYFSLNDNVEFRAIAVFSVPFSCGPVGDDDDDDDDDDTPVLVTGRACFAPGEVAAAVFITSDAVEVWTIAPDDTGELAIRYTKDDLFAQWIPGTPVKVAEADHYIHVELWMQANGFPRVTAGPDSEGKLFDCVFGGRYSRVRSYFVGTIGPDEIIPDEPESTSAVFGAFVSGLRANRFKSGIHRLPETDGLPVSVQQYGKTGLFRP